MSVDGQSCCGVVGLGKDQCICPQGRLSRDHRPVIVMFVLSAEVIHSKCEDPGKQVRHSYVKKQCGYLWHYSLNATCNYMWVLMNDAVFFDSNKKFIKKRRISGQLKIEKITASYGLVCFTYRTVRGRYLRWTKLSLLVCHLILFKPHICYLHRLIHTFISKN